jgi:hypothetical protein
MNSRLAEVGPAAWELSRLLGEAGPESDPDAAGAQLSRIERTLETMRGMVGECPAQVRQARGRAEELKSRTLASVTPAAVVLSFVCFWIGVAQVSLLSHAWCRWRGPAGISKAIGPASSS